MEKEQGEEKTKKDVDYYLEEIQAYFDPVLKEIFILDKLVGNRRNSTIANEITCYFQDILELPYLNRELQASQIKELYINKLL